VDALVSRESSGKGRFSARGQRAQIRPTAATGNASIRSRRCSRA
jgi:hypothetical protein